MRVKPPDFELFHRKTQSRAVYPLQCSLQLATGSPSQSGTVHLFPLVVLNSCNDSVLLINLNSMIDYYFV